MDNYLDIYRSTFPLSHGARTIPSSCLVTREIHLAIRPICFAKWYNMNCKIPAISYFIRTMINIRNIINISAAGLLLTGGFVFGHDTAPAPPVQPDAAAQAKLTPDSVLQELLSGNKKFTEVKLTKQDLKKRLEIATKGQHPKAYVLSCIDSRVPVELVFNQSIGDLFVGRVAGNISNVDQLGSMEYAAAVSGIKLIMVMGHESCGAVKGACDHVKMGNLTELLEEITPAVKAVKGYEEEERSSKNKKFVADVVEANVKATVADIRKNSKVLAGLEKEGKIKIVGALYSLKTGAVTLLEEAEKK